MFRQITHIIVLALLLNMNVLATFAAEVPAHPPNKGAG